MSKHFVRSIKNVTNRYTPTEITVRNATSNEPWGPSISELNEIALLTYHDKYLKEVLDVLEKRLNDKGKNWRHVMKALTILLHCIYEASDLVVDWLKKNLYLIKTLRDFRYADDRNIDQGAPIRAKASLITELIESPEKMAQEKKQYQELRANMARPGIVDLATGNAAPAKPRLTLDLSSSGRPRRSISTAIVAANSGPQGPSSTSSASASASASSSFSSNNYHNTSATSSVTSPRSSLDAWTQQSSSGAYRNKARVAPKPSMEGRYSLSLPLHSIIEESHYSAPTPPHSVSAASVVPTRAPLSSSSNNTPSPQPVSRIQTFSTAAGNVSKNSGTIRLVVDNEEVVGNSIILTTPTTPTTSKSSAVRIPVSGSPTKIKGNQIGAASSAPLPATIITSRSPPPVMTSMPVSAPTPVTGNIQQTTIPVTVLAPIVTSAVSLNSSHNMSAGSSISLSSPMSSNNPFFSMVAAQEQQQPQ
ncbi:uncharacterized protein SAPINGB_P003200 [Magnusiomyces paraingens]|uniref:ENTH domain-containing protein n=1 Tax=Magnusiomyces paraingens TaxID=2606893 RepID=A0A5E8BLF3_9ASCO|nr:uncharacterized protein SAPINGB_P003200 [Saprochaete ingens]VVT51749.1 unnamed protein product [Saprochaete ingens]